MTTLFDEFRIFVSFFPEVSFGEVRHVELKSAKGYLSLGELIVVLLQVLKSKAARIRPILYGVLQLKVIDNHFLQSIVGRDR